jgi:predicted AlkP superfamily phosphohydrolase/phosphomutase
MAKLLILGLDGATFDLILPWARSGNLPHFAQLLSKGISGRLRSTVPPMSPPAWNTFMTGTNPGKHGIFDFTERKPQSYETHFINAAWRRAPAIWQYLSEAGKRVAVLSVPFTYPPEKVNGIMVSGFDAPGVAGLVDRSATYPPELCEEIRSKVGEYPMAPNLFAATDPVEMLDMTLQTMEQKTAAALYLYQKEAWDCFVFVLGETDGTAHRFWRFCDPSSPLRDEQPPAVEVANALLTVYQKADEAIGRFLALAAQDTTIMVMSDHGNGGNSDKAVALNRWLESHGLLAFKKLESFGKSGMELAKQLGLKVLPPTIKRMLYRLTNLPNIVESWARFSAIDWALTQAYSEETPYFPSIWINLKGREPLGSVAPQAYEEVRHRLMAELASWRNPYTGQPMVKRVFRREEIYAGPHLDKAPDVMIEWELDQGYSYVFRTSMGKRRAAVEMLHRRDRRRAKSGDHRAEGIFLVTGPHLTSPTEIEGAEITDLAPTILYLFGLPVPAHMDGKVLTQIFTDEYLTSSPVHYSHRPRIEMDLAEPRQDYSEEEEEAIKTRLEGLGYIE